MPSPIKRNFFSRFTKDSNIHYDWILLAVVVILCVGGLAFLASGLSVSSVGIYQTEFQKQLLYGVWIGGVMTFILARIDYHTWFKFSKFFLYLTFILLGFLGVFGAYAIIAKTSTDSTVAIVKFLPIRPVSAGGAIRWVKLPSLPNFQPVELAKLTILIYFASVLQNHSSSEIKLINLKRPIYVFIFAAFLILVQPDLGSVALIFVILLSAMWVAKVGLKILVPITVITAIIALGLVFATPFRKGRVDAFLSEDSTKAFQVSQVRLAISNGGLWGKGYGNSEYKQAKAVPEMTTDAIIALIGEEMGFVFTTLFLSLYLILLFRAIKIANEAPDIGGKALATGIGVWISAQAFLNLASLTGLVPPKGVPLPFISAGGSSIILNLMAIGILLNISHQSTKPIGVVPKKLASRITGLKPMRN